VNSLRRLFGYRSPSPYHKLKMGKITEYSIIIDEHERAWFERRGWIEAPGLFGWGYRPKEGQIVMISRPLTLSGIIPESLIGQKIIAFATNYGSYGMGGPSFMGITLDNQPTENKVLIYAVWNSGEYIILDDRIVLCHARYYDKHRPWFSFWADEDIPNWDDLSPIIIGAEITNIDVLPDKLTLILTKNDQEHLMEFVRNDPRLCKMGNGEPRVNAFNSGVISEYILFQHPNAVLWT